ncbi:cytochrome P450 4V2-like [Schistocerca piceifrons]|uniref:cytochrome P450 4V2-like n=1 Tax=Schistocerca piceifrons TaxID=274613 RepID=UPI001F5F3A93|nr:cytochrome P450 4V2-like [Schistocerca piceifrons]
MEPWLFRLVSGSGPTASASLVAAGAAAAAVALVLALRALLSVGRQASAWLRMRRLAAQIPGPRDTHPLMGDGRLLRGEPLVDLTRIYLKHGAPCRLWVGPRLCVLLADPEHARAVLSGGPHVNRDDYMMDVLRPFTGEGLLVSRGDLWRQRRRLMSRVYNAPWLQQQYASMQRAADKLVGGLRQLWAEGVASHKESMRRLAVCTLDMTAGSVFGLQIAGTEEGDRFFGDYTKVIHSLHSRVLQPALLFNPLFKLSKLGREQAKVLKTVHLFIDDAIKSAAEKMLQRRICQKEADNMSGIKDKDRRTQSVLETLVGLTGDRRLLREELATLLLAGQDTTATALCFALQLLALHPQVQEAARHDEALQERVIKEALRLFPPGPLLSRELAADVALAGEPPTVLPAGCTAVVFVFFLHRDPRVWDDPLSFRPDRFLPEESKERHPFAFLPFGGGPRSCLGSKYAQLQMRAALSRLLPAFRVTTTATREELEDFQMGMVISPRKGFKLHFEPLD